VRKLHIEILFSICYIRYHCAVTGDRPTVLWHGHVRKLVDLGFLPLLYFKERVKEMGTICCSFLFNVHVNLVMKTQVINMIKHGPINALHDVHIEIQL